MAEKTVNETGGRLSEIRYKPWGESRYTFGATPTQRRFTGQVLDEVAGGLYFYNARYYDPALPTATRPVRRGRAR
ncbi:MAG: RHS repeat-associated core domain-containing protein [Anaerolineae bacterium]